ncbi:hypothetical protein CSW18_04620 [Thermus scotoductus]|uniref:Uncharacterized protein n=1 Tax=Thermus scotoductus TaxID=37636 RepID=A0A430RZL3_THESC|nr:hypothetical protein CSW40_04610 [Thermus scotoductus]RTI40697.1 hypothetical protein CSW18_04620 [Thermus scotoductus]
MVGATALKPERLSEMANLAEERRILNLNLLPRKVLLDSISMLEELTRELPEVWDDLPPETKGRLYRLANTIADSLLPLPTTLKAKLLGFSFYLAGGPSWYDLNNYHRTATAFVDEVYSLIERDEPAYMRLLEEGIHAAMEGRSVPLAESHLKKFLEG